MIRVDNLTVRAGGFELASISFDVAAGQYAVLMGRTGAGKTTLLEAVCGLRPVVAGRVQLDGVDVTGLDASQRGIGYVPQDGALFSTMSVREHLAFGLRLRGWGREEIAQRVRELAAVLRLEPLLERRPRGLSGGERQRVALGRALAWRPRVLLLDEPLSALDDASREQMHALLQEIRASSPLTALHVTHNREDARELADRVLVLEQGRVRELTSCNPAGPE